MGAIIVMFCMDTLFFIITVTFLRGKGSFLIAGYNTASEEEQNKYDKTKLCKAMGICTLIVSIMLAVLTYIRYQLQIGTLTEKESLPFAGLFAVVIILDVIITNIYIIKRCKHK